MTENRISAISKTYAKALVDIGAEDNSLDKIKQQFEQIKMTVDNSNDLKIVLGNTAITNSKKKEIIKDIFKDGIDEKLLRFLDILIDKNIFNEIDSIFDAYCLMSDKLTNTQNVEIISAIDLSDDIKNSILDRLKNKLHCDVVPHWTTDESIIAGLTFKFEDYVIDTSVKSEIEKFSKYMLR
ncbi:MAG: ATP synthase F1 subunit delta [Cyanobacteriota bacterium]|nr:ATP synthase F1 subunit delta [Cyanobacteriota bacterium]